MTYRASESRGVSEHGWLSARFTFSFADYYHPDHSGFHSLIVMNNDLIKPKGGFPMHPHRDAEIFTYVIRGSLEHKDSMGNGSVIQAGNLQYMSAGSGIYHSESNPADNESTELYQIWMRPSQTGGEPRYSERVLNQDTLTDNLTLIFSGDGKEGSTVIRQNAEFFFGRLKKGHSVRVAPKHGLPHAWLQLVKGNLLFDAIEMKKADGVGIDDLDRDLSILAEADSDFFLFRLS